jgi:hypothetical protein
MGKQVSQEKTHIFIGSLGSLGSLDVIPLKKTGFSTQLLAVNSLHQHLPFPKFDFGDHNRQCAD